MQEVPVLIVGGGPVGLTASILLSRQGIASLQVERHPGTAILPKARGINARTMEMNRPLGIEQAIRDAGLSTERTGFIVWTESLAGREIERRIPGRMNPANRAVTPVLNCLCAQDDVEPVLRRFAEAEPLAKLYFNTEMTAVSQDEDGVTATLTDRITGAESQVRAQYMIGADGAQSRVRRIVAREMIGRETDPTGCRQTRSAGDDPWRQRLGSIRYRRGSLSGWPPVCRRRMPQGSAASLEFLNAQGLIFGAMYDSAAVGPDGSAPPAVEDRVTQYVPSARPGGRAPHVWLERDGERTSDDRSARARLCAVGRAGRAGMG